MDLHGGWFHGWAGVLVATLALALAPLLWRLTQARRGWSSAMDGFVLTSVGGLCLLVLLPELVEHGGLWPLAAAALGVAFPVVVERLGQGVQARVRPWMAGAVLLGLMVHASLDGMALGTHSDHESMEAALLWGIVLHRLPVGLALWVAVRPSFGRGAGWAVLGGVAVATLAGALLGDGMQGMDGLASSIFQGFIIGSLLHVIVHPAGKGASKPAPKPAPAAQADACCAHDHGHGHGHEHPHAHHGEACSHEHGRRWDVWQSVGAVAGGLVAALVPGHGHEEHAAEAAEVGAGYGERLVELGLQVAPALLIGYALAGAVRLLPQASFHWLQKGGALTQALKGTLVGIPLPICASGVVPLYRGLVLERGVPAPAALAFLVATPGLGLESLLISVPLLGGPLTAARLVAALVAAVVVGLVVGRWARRPAGPAKEERPQAQRPLGERLKEAARFGLSEVVDDTAPWIVLGLAVAAALLPEGLASPLQGLPLGVDVLLCAGLGLPMYLCAAGATPLAAALLLVGVSPGAALAFLLAGPATHVASWGVLSRLHGRRVAWLFVAALLAVAVGLGIGVDLLGVMAAPLRGLPLAEAGVWEWGVLGLTAALLLASVARLGPVRFVGTVVHFGIPHAHAHSLDPVRSPQVVARQRPLVLNPARRGPVVKLGAPLPPRREEVER